MAHPHQFTGTLAALTLVLVLAISIVHPAHARFESGATVRVLAVASARVNVRSEPVVQSGNIIGKANSGDVATVVDEETHESYTWYRVRGRDEAFTGWIRGDLLEVVSPPNSDGGSQPANNAPSNAEPSHQTVELRPDLVDEPLPVQRSDWSRYLPDSIPALLACTRQSSAQPAIATDVQPLARGFIEVLISDAAERQWKCIVRDTGGTPMRFDPMYARSRPSIRDAGPVFLPAEAGEPILEPCSEMEEVVDPLSEQSVGWLIYTQCS